MSELIITKEILQHYFETERLIQNEQDVVKQYIKAIESNDAELMSLFDQFGPSIRHRVMNMHSYLCNLTYGFTYTELNQYNWLKRPDWEIELLDLATKLYKWSDLKIGKSPNLKYTYGWSFSYGYAGSSSPLSTFSTPFKSREQCVEAALNYAKREYQKGLLHSSEDGNYNHDLIKQVLKVIDGLFCSTVQFTMF